MSGVLYKVAVNPPHSAHSPRCRLNYSPPLSSSTQSTTSRLQLHNHFEYPFSHHLPISSSSTMHLHPLHLLLLSLPASSSLPSPVSQRENCTLTPPGTANACDCTQASFSSWSWSLSDLYFHSSVVFSTPAHQIDGGWVSFGLTSQATADVAFECDASSTQLQDWFYGNQWYTCTANSAAGATAQFRFDRMTGRVDVNQSWTCDDDPVYPYVLLSRCPGVRFARLAPGCGVDG